METTTKEIRQRLIKDSMDDLLVVSKEMRQEGAKNSDIERMVNNHIKIKERQFYKKKNEFSTVGECIADAIAEMIGEGPDSKAEVIFYEMMKESKIPMQFHYKIGPYEADYLVGDNLVVELDGPGHKYKREYDDRRDAYMINKGYHILRLDLHLIALDPKAAILGIKELANA